MVAETEGLRSLLGLVGEDESALRLAAEGGRAYVSSSLRPYLIAALTEIDDAARSRPTLVIVGDDRARATSPASCARGSPAQGSLYPSRGVAYESHLAPPAHLVGLRVAALDALLAAAGAPAEQGGSGAGAGADAAAGQPVVVVSATALSEKVPDPELRPHSFTLRVGELLDLEECAAELVAAGYERADQVEERGQFALRGGLLDVFPATEERAVRVDMFDVEIESLRGSRRSRSAPSGMSRRSRSRPRPSSPPSTASSPRSRRRPARSRRATRRSPGGRTSRTCCRSIASARCWTC